MQGNGRYAMGAMIVAVFGALLAGCVLPQDTGTSLLVSPDKLDFGTTENRLTVKVAKNYSSTTVEPIVVEANQPWILPRMCLDTANNCVSKGPLDSVYIPVDVDRQKMTIGANMGLITIRAGRASVKTIEVMADDTLSADFDVSSRAVEVGRSVSFTDLSVSNEGNITQRLWDFGDGITSTDINPMHAFQASGQYTITLSIHTADNQETIQKEAFVTVGSTPPVANFTTPVTEVFEGAVVQFTDQSTSISGPIVRRSWDFGDGTTSDALNPSHQYLNVGTYTVSLTAYTEFSQHTAAKPNYIIVKRKIVPTARFALSQAKPFVGIPVQFTDLSDAGSAPINKWTWNFGDGIMSTEQNPKHAFKAVGTYDVKFTVISAHGINTMTLPVEVVYMPPSADFEADDLIPSANAPVAFKDLSKPGTAPISTWEWDFGDNTHQVITRVEGSIENGNTTHTYAKAGTYTVELKVTMPLPSNNTDTEVKESYIVVYDPPKVAFTVSTRSPLAKKEIRFTNTTTPGTEKTITYEWNFGDTSSLGNTSTEQDGRHTYLKSGEYTVVLTAITPTRKTKSTPVKIVVDTPPTPAFSYSPEEITTFDTVSFIDQSLDTGARPILGRTWDFGDGAQSSLVNPSHQYSAKGTYAVKLRLIFQHSASGESLQTDPAVQSLVVTVPTPPTAKFRAVSPCAMVGVPVAFSDLSTVGTRPILSWLWDFGNGVTSNQRWPQYKYALPGTYTVKLTVTDTLGQSNTFERRDYIEVMANGKSLDSFVRTPDPAYTWTPTTSQDVSLLGFGKMGTAYITRMTSQSWRTADEVYDGLLWQHNVTVFSPVNRAYDTALLFIDGGSRTSSPPNSTELELLGQLSALSGSVVVSVDNVPSQPIVFTDEVDNGVILRSRSEDAIIAYSYDKFMTEYAKGNNDPTWPVLFPMAKSAVRAMDTAQAILEDAGLDPVKDFVVTGGSKRGWTTWLTGVTDCRIRAIAPIVIDVLNMDKQMEHHRNVYGYWAPSIYEYAQMKVFDRLLPTGNVLLPEAEALLSLVDPYEYRDRMADIPKFLMNSSGDEFFVPDSAQWYFSDLLGEKYLNYVPNQGHGLGDSMDIENDAVQDLLAWYLSEIQGVSMPQFTTSVGSDGVITVNILNNGAGLVSVQQWQATNPDARDFRHTIRSGVAGPTYTVAPLTPTSGSTYKSTVTAPAQGYTAYFIQLTFKNPASYQVTGIPGLTAPNLVFTSPIRVTPNAYPAFDGERQDINGIPFVKVYGDARTMGEQYGRLMKTEIAALLSTYISQSGYTSTALDQAWTNQSALMDPRIVEEINGIAAGSALSVQTVRRAQMVDVLRVYSATNNTACSTAVWGDATGMPSEYDIAKPLLHSYTMNTNLVANGPQNNPCVVMYIPKDGFPHVSFTFAGLVFSHIGMNIGGVSVADIPDANDAQAVSILNFLPAMREILYESNNLTSGLETLQNLLPTRSHHYVMGDGRFESRGAKIQRDNTGYYIWRDNDPDDEYAPDVLQDLVYSLDATQQATFFDLLSAAHGNLTQDVLQTLTNSLGKPGKNIMNVVMDNTGFSAVVSYANGTTPANQGTYVPFYFQLELP